MTSCLSRAFNKSSASAEKRNTSGMLTSSVPSPDIANIGELLAEVPGVLSSTMPPTAPRVSNLRACERLQTHIGGSVQQLNTTIWKSHDSDAHVPQQAHVPTVACLKFRCP
ncbi:hypothetical protein E2C01_005938 [Portunus trituberculatus]|uniref:Uncharacterized protein n=1 Tax=Portunus trituberculatus TaxID=210409 RepID=A0A5B7CVR9_PORTR|nr:hypothetical protein [Portunus trituberculatus]